MENINITDLKKRIKELSKNPKKNYHEILAIYQKIVVHYYYLKKSEEDF
jgi:hypothetical protein